MDIDLDVKFHRLLDLLDDRVEELVEGMFVGFDRDSDWFVHRPELRERTKVLAIRSGRAELAAMRAGELPDRLADVDLELARESARAGSPAIQITDGYRRGHAAWWQGWFELVEKHEPDPDARRGLLRRGSDFFFAYAGRMTQLISKEHLRERDRMLRSQEQRRVHLVNELLAGGHADTAALDYDVDGHHLGVVAWGEQSANLVRELGDELERRLLLVRVADEACWAWLGASRALDDRARRRLERLDPAPGNGIGVGAEEVGLEGFGRTHRQAVEASHAGVRAVRAVTHYDDVALEALAASDEGAAREFATRELRGLDGDDARGHRLRETLLAYFAHGHNASATAAALGVHEQTVAQRLRAVEERIGRPVSGRRAELEVALRLRRRLDPAGEFRRGD